MHKVLEQLEIRSLEDLLRGFKEISKPGYDPIGGASKNFYLVNPEDQRLWDLKELLRAQARFAKGDPRLDFADTSSLRDALLELGVEIVGFDAAKKRCLGIRCNDRIHLEEPHTLFKPGGTKIKDGAKGYGGTPPSS